MMMMMMFKCVSDFDHGLELGFQLNKYITQQYVHALTHLTRIGSFPEKDDTWTHTKAAHIILLLFVPLLLALVS